ncbi:PEGA domain-containing protein [Sorangium sp. So ce295]|uniref:PEGA domain-containing protein n=1 Tax=Sorangium sp. So ce295 TaxID=3133295 RepID=UPI003F639638
MSSATASDPYFEAELESAWELNPTFDVAYNLGNTEYQLKKHKEAATYLSFALRNWPLLKGVAKLKPNAEKWLAESRAQVGALKVSVTVAGAEVLVDGKSVGRAPLEGEVFVDPGEHRVEATHMDYEPANQTVSVAKGGTAEAKLAITPVKAEPRASAGATTEGGGERGGGDGWWAGGGAAACGTGGAAAAAEEELGAGDRVGRGECGGARGGDRDDGGVEQRELGGSRAEGPDLCRGRRLPGVAVVRREMQGAPALG